KQLLRQHIKLMVLPLVADMVITLPLLYLTWDKPIYILAFYFTSVIFLIPMSFVWSLFTPKKINSTFQLKGSTSQFSVFVTMAGVLLITTLRINAWFYMIIPFYILIAVVAVWASVLYYNDGKSRLVRNLR
ncbi:MAG: hypothetical protein WC341_09270, partial [Bacteroidales bacterium]